MGVTGVELGEWLELQGHGPALRPLRQWGWPSVLIGGFHGSQAGSGERPQQDPQGQVTVKTTAPPTAVTSHRSR